MVKIKAAVCHEFGAPLKIETIDLREPITGEVEVTLGAVAVCPVSYTHLRAHET